MNPKKLNASQLRVNGPPTYSLPRTSKLRYAGAGNCCWDYPYQGVFFQLGAWWCTRHSTLLRDLAVSTDASLWGMAGTLYLKGVPHSWWAQEIDENYLERMAAVHGDPAWQPE